MRLHLSDPLCKTSESCSVSELELQDNLDRIGSDGLKRFENYVNNVDNVNNVDKTNSVTSLNIVNNVNWKKCQKRKRSTYDQVLDLFITHKEFLTLVRENFRSRTFDWVLAFSFKVGQGWASLPRAHTF